MSSRSVPIPRTSRRALDCSRRSSRDRWRTSELAEQRVSRQRAHAEHHDLKSKCSIVAGRRVLDLMDRDCKIDAGDVGVLAAVEMSKRTKPRLRR